MSKRNDHTYRDCTVTVRSVQMGLGVYLNRVRVWDATGAQLIAMRVWSNRPFELGLLMNMQPTEAPKAPVRLPDVLAALEAHDEEEA